MTIYAALTQFAADWRAAREDARTRHLVAALPVEIQKDIGWPDAGRESRLRNRQQPRCREILP